jgi:hypothetical protein
VRKEAPVATPGTLVNLMDALISAEKPAAKKGKAAERVSRQVGKRKAG